MSSKPRPDPAATSPDDDRAWTKVIRAERAGLWVSWKELWRYRDLIWTLAARDVATTYKQTVLGPLWFILQPLMVTVVFSYLFGRMADFGSSDIPHFLFYLGGLVPWGFFSETVLKNSNIFVLNASLFSKVYFPRFSVALAGLLTNVVPLAAQFLLFLAGLGFYLLKKDPFTHPNWWILATPIVFVQLGLLGLGLGCIVSALSRRFRDLSLSVRIGLQLLMFGSAIVFPLSRIAPNERWIFLMNPVVPPIEFFRYAFVGKWYAEPRDMMVSAVVSVCVFLLGLILFHRAEQNAMDSV